MPYDRHHYAQWSTAKQIEAKIAETDDAYTLQELQAAQRIQARPLPPDPDEKNGDRAADADTAIRVYRAETGANEDDATARLLANLMHWCDRAGQDFARELGRAQLSYAAETTPARAVA
jgi:hypothetical protein